MKSVPVPLIALARPAEIFLDQSLDDLPLRGIGVLRLVDQHMVDLAIELVPDPVAHSRRREQPPRPVDQIVEVRDTGGALGTSVSRGEGLPRAKPGCDISRKPGTVLDAQQLTDQHRKTPGMRLIMRVGLRLAGTDPKRVLLGQYDLAKLVEPRRPLDGVSASHFSMISAWPRPVCAPHLRFAPATA